MCLALKYTTIPPRLFHALFTCSVAKRALRGIVQTSLQYLCGSLYCFTSNLIKLHNFLRRVFHTRASLSKIFINMPNKQISIFIVSAYDSHSGFISYTNGIFRFLWILWALKLIIIIVCYTSVPCILLNSPVLQFNCTIVCLHLIFAS